MPVTKNFKKKVVEIVKVLSIVDKFAQDSGFLSFF